MALQHHNYAFKFCEYEKTILFKVIIANLLALVVSLYLHIQVMYELHTFKL